VAGRHLKGQRSGLRCGALGSTAFTYTMAQMCWPPTETTRDSGLRLTD